MIAFVILLAVALSLAWLALRGRNWRRIGSRPGSSSDLLFYSSDGGTHVDGGSDAACGADGGSCDGGDGGD